MRKNSLLLALAALTLLIAAAPAGADDRYAVVGGSGPVASCPLDNPCSLDNALNSTYTNDFDVVHIAAGGYTTSNQVSIPKHISVVGAGIDKTKIQSLMPTSEALHMDNADAQVSDLEFDSSSTTATAFLFRGTLNRVVVRNPVGDACTASSGVILNSLCVSGGNGRSGFSMDVPSSYSSLLRNSTFIGEGAASYGIYVHAANAYGPASASVDARGVIAVGKAKSIFASADGTSTAVFSADHSSFADTVAVGPGTVSVTAAGSGSNQSAAPAFVNAASGDYREAAGSPTIDAGATDPFTGNFDITGAARVQGAAADIGAYESTPAIPAAPVARDTVAPKLTVSKKPKSKTTSKKLSVTFKASETATFQCKLDKGKFKTCKSPYKKTVKLGKHKLQIRATDAAGNVSSVKSVSWKVVSK